MDEQTVRALNAINRNFYRQQSFAFDATRAEPWPGWRRLWDDLGNALVEPQQILDVACGNGRFAAYCAQRLGGLAANARYTGVDSSETLLARARDRALPFGEVELRAADLVEQPNRALPPGDGPYSLIALFGILHHIPSHALRDTLLLRLGQSLAPGGTLVVAAWQFEAFARFRNRLVPWAQYNEDAVEPIDTDQLESGDHLLPWGEPPSGYRYCHFTSEDDTRQRLQRTGFEIVDSYTADGREGHLNRYFVCRFSAAQVVPNRGVAGR